MKNKATLGHRKRFRFPLAAVRISTAKMGGSPALILLPAVCSCLVSDSIFFPAVSPNRTGFWMNARLLIAVAALLAVFGFSRQAPADPPAKGELPKAKVSFYRDVKPIFVV